MKYLLSLFFILLSLSADAQVFGGPVVGGGGGGAPSGSAGGDLGGTYPNPTVLNLSHVTTGTLDVANGGTGVTAAQNNGIFVGPNPIAGATAEYPLNEGTGTVVNDASGSGNTANFCAGANAPTWKTFGVSFNDGLTVGPPAINCIATPLMTWKTVFINSCVAPLASGAVAATALPYARFPTVLGSGAVNGLRLIGVPQGASTATFSAPFYPTILAGIGPTYKTYSSTYQNQCTTTAYVLAAADHIYQNGAEVPYTLQGVSSGLVTSTSPYYIGALDTVSTQLAWSGYINYVVFYNTALTLAQVQAETNYINAKVNSRTGYPVYPSYSLATTPQIICAGDSLTCGLGGAGTCTSWCDATDMGVLGSYTYNNFGYGSNTAFSATQVDASYYLQAIAPKGQRNILHEWYVTNDVSSTTLNRSAAQAWASISQIGINAAKNGSVAIVATMVDRLSQDVKKNAVNALIRANWRKYFAALNDVAAIPSLGADGSATSPGGACFLAGGIHLTPVGAGTCYNSLGGYGVIAAQAGKVINILDGSTLDNPTVTTSNAYVETISDNYVLQTPTLAATNTLPDCTGLTSIERTIINGSAVQTITAQTSASQTITGSAAILPNTRATFTCELIADTTGGNYWLRTQ